MTAFVPVIVFQAKRSQRTRERTGTYIPAAQLPGVAAALLMAIDDWDKLGPPRIEDT